MFAQSRYEAFEILAGANLRIERVVIYDIVAVHASRTGTEVGRTIDVADAQGRQVGDRCNRVVERELGVQLNAIGRARNP